MPWYRAVRPAHPAGTDRAEAERLAAKLAAKERKRVDAVRSLTVGAYLTSLWLPAKKLQLATSESDWVSRVLVGLVSQAALG